MRQAARARVLVIDDGPTYAEMVGRHLGELELVAPLGESAARHLTDGPAALAYLALHAGDVDIVLLDMHFDVPPERLLPLGDDVPLKRTQRFQGVAILRELRRAHPQLPVVLLTSIADLSLVDAGGELAAQSMTYVLDGDDLDTLRIRIHTALHEAAGGLEDGTLLWGRDAAMQALRRRLGIMARGGLPVLLEGETGTGKSFLAEHWVHAQSGRSGPFVVVDLASVPSELVPAYLFGAQRGAYTGAVADRKGMFELATGGTILLDEIQNVPLDIQRQLLVVLQERRVRPLGASREVPVDVKVVAASNRPLAESVAAGRFREDLYMRLSPATAIRIPSLRQRPADLPFLARRLVERAALDPDNDGLRRELSSAVFGHADAALTLVIDERPAREPGTLELVLPGPVWKRLVAHPWPGNLRELGMVMHSLVGFTLVSAVDALDAGLTMGSARLQVDPGLVGQLLGAARPPGRRSADDPSAASSGDVFAVHVKPAGRLSAVASELERQVLRQLFEREDGDFAQMAALLLGDARRARAVRLRFNQLGLRARELRRP